jgi:hypothetical protein
MLPGYIIEELRRREEEARRREEAARPRLELPVPTKSRRSEPPKKESDRGITIIEVWG